MALTSSSTDAQVDAQYDDNASYMDENSIAKAKLFVQACRILLRRLASTATKGSNSVSFRVDLIHSELKAAEAWLYATDESLRAYKTSTHADFRQFRGF